jgi:rRNA maturation protein Nop10
MTTEYEKCPGCKAYRPTTTTCDGCGKVVPDGAPRWSINARWSDDTDRQHACSGNCLEKALEDAGWEDGQPTNQLVRLTWEGSQSDAFVLVRQVSSQSKG